MGGLESIQQFRHWASTASSTSSEKRQFIIVVSANCTALHQQESLDSGADDFHAKPINMATLVATIEQRRLSTAGTSTTATAASTAASTAAATATAGGDCETAASATAPRRRLSNILAAHTSLFSGSASSKSASHSPVAAEQQQQQQSQRRDSWAPTLSFHSLSNNSSSSSADKDA
jgi:DNA-binding response OmpR family regulator